MSAKVVKKMQSFRLSTTSIQALDEMADKTNLPKNRILEWLIEREYKSRVASGEIRPNQDIFDIFHHARAHH